MADNEVKDERPKGRLAVPKNFQTYVIIGVAAIVLLVSLFGGSTPKPKADAGVAPPATPRTDDLAARLAAQQAEQARLQAAIPSQEELAAKPTPEQLQIAPEDRAYLAGLMQTGGGGVGESQDQLAEARRTRAYASLFASNVALSYRPRPPVRAGGGVAESAAETAQPAVSDAEVAQLAALLQAGASAQAPAPARERPPAANANNRVAARNATHTVFEGTVLEAVLLNRINADFSGPIVCHVSVPLLSHSRRHMLIPAGSRVLGAAQRVADANQQRVAVAFHRLIMPDGYAVNLDQFTGLNARGETALKDKVNHHYARMFGGSIALGALAGLSALGTSYGGLEGVPMEGRLRQGAAGGFAQAADRVLQQFLNAMPTLTIREGHRVRIYFTQDLELPAYADHDMNPDL